MLLRSILFVFSFFFLLSPLSLATSNDNSSVKKYKIGFFTPHSEGNTYWPEVMKLLERKAEALQLSVIHFPIGSQDRFTREEQVLKVLQTKERPDAIIVNVNIFNAKKILAVAESLKIPVVIQGPLFPREIDDLGGKPGLRFRHWIGYFHQDEREKGYRLGKTLLKFAHEAKAYAKDGKIHVLGISGVSSWYGTVLREEGLRKAIAEDPKAMLQQTVNSNWSVENGVALTRKMLNRFPESTVIWASSDQLAIAAARSFEKSGKILGKNAFTGGLDLSEAGLGEIKKNRLSASVSVEMPFFEDVLHSLDDYLNGRDSRFRREPMIVFSDVKVVTRED